MLPAATIRALMNPAFNAVEFIPTQWDTAEDKAKFANAIVHRQRISPAGFTDRSTSASAIRSGT